MDKRILALLGVGVIGAVAYLILGSSSTSEGGAFDGGGGNSKKEADTSDPIITYTETETTEPLTLDSPVYNISLPAVNFPAIPQPNIETPWWVTSANPPAETSSTKKQQQTQQQAIQTLQTAPPTPYVTEHPISTNITTTLVKAGVMKPTFATQLLGYK